MKRNAPMYVMGFMAVLSAVFGSAVSLVHYATRDRLAANEQLNHNRVVCDAFDLPVDGRAPADYARAMSAALETAVVPDENGRRVYRRHDGPEGRLGFTFSGMGFWDRIQGFMTLSSDRETLMRLRFIDHKETPGLGGRIEEPDFLAQFDRLPIDWNAPPERRIVIGTGPDPGAASRVDAITGATQTSSALMVFLNRELERIRTLEIDALEFKPLDFAESF